MEELHHEEEETNTLFSFATIKVDQDNKVLRADPIKSKNGEFEKDWKALKHQTSRHQGVANYPRSRCSQGLKGAGVREGSTGLQSSNHF